jgi:hypothetical protein
MLPPSQFDNSTRQGLAAQLFESAHSKQQQQQAKESLFDSKQQSSESEAEPALAAARTYPSLLRAYAEARSAAIAAAAASSSSTSSGGRMVEFKEQSPFGAGAGSRLRQLPGSPLSLSVSLSSHMEQMGHGRNGLRRTPLVVCNSLTCWLCLF